MRGQHKALTKRDLEVWGREYGGSTAEGIARRVINRFQPAAEELSTGRKANQGQSKTLDKQGLGSNEPVRRELSSLALSGISFRYIFQVLFNAHLEDDGGIGLVLADGCISSQESHEIKDLKTDSIGKTSNLSIPRPWKSASALFKNSIRERIKAENCNLSIKDLNILLAQKWDLLPLPEKSEWLKKSEEDEKRWMRETEEFQQLAKVIDEDFTNTALYMVLDRCFMKEELDNLIGCCIEKNAVAFASLEKTKSKTKQERLKLFCACPKRS